MSRSVWRGVMDRPIVGSMFRLGLTVLVVSTARAGLADDQLSTSSVAPTHPPVAATDTRAHSSLGATVPRRLRDVRLESDNWTFRPTVLVRRGTSQGSGTIIASVSRETLISTAAHVLRGKGPIIVELHRYNLGAENQPKYLGSWPRQIAAEVVGSDLTADVAVLRVREMVALPYTAKLRPENEELTTNADLTSVGIDLGSKLSSWGTNLVEVLWFELNDSGSDRPFLITSKIPEHGRSGGGLYDSEGRLVGVCVGHAELVKGKRMGIFSSVDNIRQLLNAHELMSVIARSEARRARLDQLKAASRGLIRPARTSVRPTEASRAEDLP